MRRFQKLKLFNTAVVLWITAGAGASLAISINFESVADDTLLSNQFLSLGVKFTGAGDFSGRIVSEGDFGISNFGNSPTHVVHVGSRSQPTTFSFVDPGNPNTIIGTLSFSVLIGDGDTDSESVDVTIRNEFGEVLSGPTTYSTTNNGFLVSGSTALLGARIGSVELNLRADSPSGITFDDLTFAPVNIVLPGDYNNDGNVDAADYVAWRKNEGAAAGTLPNDIDGGTIGPPQYATWRNHFGEPAGPGAGTGENLLRQASIPEPTSAVLLMAVILVAWPTSRIR